MWINFIPRVDDLRCAVKHPYMLGRFFIICFAVFALPACSTLPRPVTPVAVDTLNYSEEIGQAKQQQMLLNVVRLRYNDPVSFVDVERLSTNDRTSFDSRLSTTVPIDGSPLNEVLNGNVGSSQNYSPTVVYQALRGKSFADLLLRPVPPSTIFLLSQSGWNIEQMMMCCVARIGDIDNVRDAAGPGPSIVADNSEFLELARLMRETQIWGGLLVQVVNGGVGPVEEGVTPDTEPVVIFKWHRGTQQGKDLAEFLTNNWATNVKDLAGNRFTTSISTRGNLYGDFAFRGRSVLGTMSAMSLGVHVPAAHAEIAPPLQGEAGALSGHCAAPPAAQSVVGPYFSVSHSLEKPEMAAVAVKYRGYWFYIDDRCRDAKATLDLLNQLYALQAGISSGSDTLILLGG